MPTDPTLPAHLCGYHPDAKRHPWETACGRRVVPFSPVTTSPSLVTCEPCLTVREACPPPVVTHPTPSAMAREAYPPESNSIPAQRIAYAAGITIERARVVAELRALLADREAAEATAGSTASFVRGQLSGLRAALAVVEGPTTP